MSAAWRTPYALSECRLGQSSEQPEQFGNAEIRSMPGDQRFQAILAGPVAA
jgi:hypothetical protein